MQKYYYKATLAGGVSGYDRSFVYKLGLNVHPMPDKQSEDACGIGIHLAKTLLKACDYVPRATGFYLARAGVILGEDVNKIRCDSCTIIRRINPIAAERLVAREEKAERERLLVEKEKEKERKRMQRFQAEQRERECKILNTNLISNDWLKQHMGDFTQEDINNLKLEIKNNGRTVRLGLAMKKKDRLYILKGALA